MMIHEKLVRDRIPEIIRKQGRSCATKVLSDAEYREELKRKLSEEVAEYLESESLEELADILEVLHALAEAGGHAPDELEDMRAHKAEERGGFAAKTYLIHVTEVGE